MEGNQRNVLSPLSRTTGYLWHHLGLSKDTGTIAEGPLKENRKMMCCCCSLGWYGILGTSLKVWRSNKRFLKDFNTTGFCASSACPVPCWCSLGPSMIPGILLDTWRMFERLRKDLFTDEKWRIPCYILSCRNPSILCWSLVEFPKDWSWTKEGKQRSLWCVNISRTLQDSMTMTTHGGCQHWRKSQCFVSVLFQRLKGLRKTRTCIGHSEDPWMTDAGMCRIDWSIEEYQPNLLYLRTP